jgi:rhamnosyl/mannosyltransferase
MQMSRDLGLEGRVRFLGDVSAADLPRLYAAADVFVLPSILRAEAFGLVLLEAMAAGLPCVTTELGTGSTFIVQDEVTGLVVPPHDAAALAAALRRLAADPALRTRLGAAGRARLLAHFTASQMTAHVEQIYRECIATFPRAKGS